MKYFAYGSNMSERRMQERVLGATNVCDAMLRGWKLVFNKLSIDGSAKANIVHTGDRQDKVYGCIYTVPRAQKLNLDHIEGKGKGYHAKRLRIGRHHVFFYVADDNAIVENVKPYDWYTELMLSGVETREVPVRYTNLISNTETQVDTDFERALRNRCAITGDYAALLQMDTATEADAINIVTDYTVGMLVRKHIIKPKFFRQVDAEKKLMFMELLRAFNAAFDTTITVQFLDAEESAGSNYTPQSDHIQMHGLSVMTFIHEYGHALQHAGVQLTRSDDAEVDAQEWSHTIFFIAAPHMYLKARDEEKFYHDNVRMVAPFVAADGEMPADNVLKNRFYKYFDLFVAYVKCNTAPHFTTDDLLAVVEGHASLTRHVHKIAIA